MEGPAGKQYPKPTTVTAEGDRAGSSVAGLGDVNGDEVPDVLVSTPGWNNSAGAVHVIHGHRGRSQGNIPLYNGSPLPSTAGYTIYDGNTPAREQPVYAWGNPWSADSAVAGQIIEQTDETQCQVGPNQTCVFASNYMWEPGDQAGSAAAATGTGSGGRDRRTDVWHYPVRRVERDAPEPDGLV